jgi:Xaa-Pro aminopeptidase
MAAGRTLRGFEVDDAVAGHIQTCGYGPHIRHRTGHSIGREVHGVGANMDNMETHDERPVIPWTCFSVEPALYLPTFGVRTEVNVFVEERGARVTGEMQTEFVRLC